MSYDRSPRAVCSTTIGTKFNALVSTDRLPLRTQLRAHEFLETQIPRRASRTREQEVDDLVLEHRRLDLRHHGTVAAVELGRLLGFLVRRRQLLDALIDPALVEFDLVVTQKLLNEQTDRDTTLREGLETLARRRFADSRAARLPQSVCLEAVDL